MASKSLRAKIPGWTYLRENEVNHQGETVEQFLARGGQIKKLPPGVVQDALAYFPTLQLSRKIRTGTRK